MNSKLNEYLNEIRSQINNDFASRFDSEIKYGPFKGARLYPNPKWGKTDQITMMLGLYELEIQDDVVKFFRESDVFIDLGCGDGYYLAAASRFSNLETIIGHDNDNHAIAHSSMVLQANQVHEGRVDKAWEPERLNRFLIDLSREGKTPFLMMDIEGGEFDLVPKINFELIPNIKFICEVHDFDTSQAKMSALARKMAASLKLKFVVPGERNPFAYPEIDYLETNLKWLTMSEGRTSGNQWVVASR